MKCIIVDDEPIACDGIETQLAKHPELELKGVFNNCFQAQEYLKYNSVDLIFLDINMPGQTGLEFAELNADLGMIIFTTAYPQYAIESYTLDAIDYLLKPIRPERFDLSVKKALQYHKLLKSESALDQITSVENDYIFVKSDRKLFKVMFGDILFIEGLKDYVIVHLSDQKIITNINIKNILLKLPAHTFARVSKSYIINVNQIVSLDANTVQVYKTEIPIGNTYREVFFNDYIYKKAVQKP